MLEAFDNDSIRRILRVRRRDWVKVSSELTQGRRAWSASVRDVVNAIGDAGSTRPG